VVPFLSPYRAWEIGLGTLAVDIAGAVIITSLLRVRFGFRAWRAVHWLAYVAWPVAFAHSITAGTDLTIWWVALTEWACAAAVAVAVTARVLFTVRDSVVPGTPTATWVPPEIPEDFFSRDRAHH
jgi:methionine sulfoxide reductase heme-binding subunit